MVLSFDVDDTICPDDHGLSFEERPLHYLKVKPWPIALQTIQQLKALGHTIVLVTARNQEGARPLLEYWCQLHSLPYDYAFTGIPIHRRGKFLKLINSAYHMDDRWAELEYWPRGMMTEVYWPGGSVEEWWEGFRGMVGLERWDRQLSLPLN